MGDAKRRRAAGGDGPRRVAVPLTDQERAFMATFTAELQAVQQRASNALTGILLGRRVDLAQFDGWGLAEDGAAALLTPKPWPAGGDAPPGADG